MTVKIETVPSFVVGDHSHHSGTDQTTTSLTTKHSIYHSYTQLIKVFICKDLYYHLCTFISCLDS